MNRGKPEYGVYMKQISDSSIIDVANNPNPKKNSCRLRTVDKHKFTAVVVLYFTVVQCNDIVLLF